MRFMHMRIARPVASPETTFQLYARGLGFERLGAFTDHDGFSGIMMGHAGLPWHIELTACLHHPVKPAPTEEDLLVLYYPDAAQWRQVCTELEESGFRAVSAFNPYWDKNGKTFVDPDGYRLVIQNQRWPQI
ncbi:MAG TPA: prolyl endopeptidase [Franconibacter helveticus]|uniref:VOC family protein n=1 Tax=Franconibacter helveticus TaxID=357240 RepID=UPI000465F6BC|nr:VOC family protein [Franconibacter helveticus]MDU6925161.1 VOC family protein [Franconibacter helveticus]HAZ54383.1 prolyl endopeptidase [Franconibacter helveticus]